MICSKLCTLILLIAFSNTIWAKGLVWDRMDVNLKAGLLDKEVYIEFPFKNKSNKTVNVQEIVTMCGCTDAKTDKQKYKSGDDGVLSIVFTIGDRQGFQRKFVTLRARGEEYLLKLNIEIPEAARITPALLFWKVGGDLDEKKILIELFDNEMYEGGKPEIIKLHKVPFDLRINEVIDKENSFELVVQPRNLDNKVTEQLWIETNHLSPSHRMHRVFLMIK